MKKAKNHLKDIYERGNDYDQSELLSNSPCGAYVTIEMFNQVINKLISLINEKQEKLKLGYIEYKNEKYLHDVNDKDIFAEVANKAINDEYGDNIEQTYLKKKDQSYQYNEEGEIIGINDVPIAAATGSLPLKGEDGIYVRNDLTANIIGISADYAYASALSSKQDALVFNGNNNKITAINNSAIGGTEYTAGLDLKIDNGIISVNANDCTTNITGYTFAIGNSTTANGTNTVAIGLSTSAADNQTFAGGTRTSANGSQTFAIGSYTSAGGSQSFAGGHNTTAYGSQTFVYGLNLNSVTDNNFVIGKNNDVTTYSADPLFIIGNGTTSTNSNAFVVYSDGYVTAQGDLGVTFASGNETYSYDVGHALTELSGGSTNWNITYTTVTSNSSTWNAALIGVSVDDTPLTVTNNTVNIVLTGKVDKDGNKVLSTNDYTDAATAVVANASAVIPSNATSNNQLVTNDDLTGALANFGGFVVTSINSTTQKPDVANPDTKTIYLTKDPNLQVTDPYTEWIYTSSSPSTTAWEVIGETTVDLSNYYTKSQSDSRYCTETTAKKLADYAGGNGIVVAGDVYTTKSIASNLTEVPLQDGTGIHVTVVTGGASDYAEIAAKPEILFYQTTSPITANSDSQISFQLSNNYTAFNTKTANSSLNVTNTSITGLDSNKLYNYNIKACVHTNSTETVALKGPNWNSNYSWTSAYVVGDATMELDCYVKGVTGIEISSFRTGTAEIGIIEASVTEVCDV